MKAQEFIKRLTHTLEELLSLTMNDDTGSELEHKLGVNGEPSWLSHGAYGMVENCKKVLDNLLSFEGGNRCPTDWQQRYLIPAWERALDIYWPDISRIDEYYSTKTE